MSYESSFAREATHADSAVDRVTDEAPIDRALAYAFAPLHKSAFGIATGVAGAIVMAGMTVAALTISRVQDFPVQLFSEYFAGYTISWMGVVVGAAWGFVVAFVAGWFFAFCRNLALAVTAFTLRVRAELTQTKDFLDHI
jgi:hypothetical protein